MSKIKLKDQDFEEHFVTVNTESYGISAVTTKHDSFEEAEAFVNRIASTGLVINADNGSRWVKIDDVVYHGAVPPADESLDGE